MLDLNAGFTNEKYASAGAKVIDNLKDLYSSADIIFKVQRPMDHPDLKKHELDLMKEGTILVTFLYPLNYPDEAKKCAEKRNRCNLDGYDSKYNSGAENGCAKLAGKSLQVIKVL